MNKKSIILSIFLIVFFVGVGVAGYMLWPAINGVITKNKYYTSEQVQESYDKGYSDGINNEKELNSQVDYYRDLTDEYYSQIIEYQKQVTAFEQSTASLQESISQLTTLKQECEKTIEKLRTENLSQQSTINSLAAQIVNLNSQISEMSSQVQNNRVVVAELNKKIEDLEQSIKYYNDYIKSLNVDDKAVVTFEFDGSIINIQLVVKGSKVSIVNPESSEYVIFNFWTVDGEQIDLVNYTVQDSVTIVANCSYKFKVSFSVDGHEEESQIVDKNGFATSPSIQPSKPGYEFAGWSVNGNDVVDIESYEIVEKTTFVAKFTQLHTVKFEYEGRTLSTQTIRHGEYATQSFEVDADTANKVFAGWTVNGLDIVDLKTYAIFDDTTFSAKINYKYNVKFVVDDNVVSTQVLGKDDKVVIPSTPSRILSTFDGWTVNGDIVDVAKYKIEKDTTFVAKFTLTKTFDEATWDEINTISTNYDASKFFNVGDIKKFSQNGYTYSAVILGFNHDQDKDGKTVGITLQYLNNAQTTSLPTEISKYAKEVKKVTVINGVATITVAKTFALSLSEVFSEAALSSCSDSNISSNVNLFKQEGTQYEYFKLSDDNFKRNNWDFGLGRYMSSSWQLRSCKPNTQTIYSVRYDASSTNCAVVSGNSFPFLAFCI